MDKILLGSSFDLLPKIADKSCNMCVTSPPYFGLRDYGHTGQIGLEQTPEQYIEKLVKIFREVKRILKNDGTLWVNIGDSYAGSGKKYISEYKQATNRASTQSVSLPAFFSNDQYKPKDLIGIPWMLAFALRADGWFLRQDIIWNKPNPMPESVTDRCTKAHEYIFLLSKSNKYYYDHESIKTPIQDATVQRMLQQIQLQKGSDRAVGKTNGTMKAVGPGRNPRPSDSRKGNQGSSTGIKAYTHREPGDKKLTNHSGNFDQNGDLIGDGYANKKSVWTVTTKPYKEAHFATFPQDLIIDCIKAGCPEGGVVLDPFMGAGTTAVVSRKLNRHFIGCEINPDYVKIANDRLKKEIGIFL